MGIERQLLEIRDQLSSVIYALCVIAFSICTLGYVEYERYKLEKNRVEIEKFVSIEQNVDLYEKWKEKIRKQQEEDE